MDDRPTYIYVLCEPDGESVRYVGKTVDLAERYHQHTNAYWLGREHTHRANWVKSLLAHGEKPVMKTIEVLGPDDDWEERERFWIAHYRSLGCDLTNLTDGGDGVDAGYKHSEESRQHMSEAQRGRKHSPETRAKMSASATGHQRTKGRKQSPEHVARRAEAQRGRPGPWLGRKHTEESRRKMSESQRGRVSPLRGRKQSPELVEKRRLSRQATMERRKREREAQGA